MYSPHSSTFPPLLLFSVKLDVGVSTPTLLPHLTVSAKLTLVRFGVHSFLEFYLVNITNDFHAVKSRGLLSQSSTF